ncbi:hypothetical protein, partial [Nocardia cyriacigeorgica]|uniref:hypothetical protein n=1 Tax=Nocardia cyriacigeorgica TaxID=135487 RepID=UPI0024578AF3
VYIAWFLIPALAFIDWRRAAGAARELAELIAKRYPPDAPPRKRAIPPTRRGAFRRLGGHFPPRTRCGGRTGAG